MLLPESPCDSNVLSSYAVLTSESGYERTDSYDADVDMRDTETHPGSGGESDRDSTTVSYSLDEDNLRDVEEEAETLEFKESQGGEDVGLQEYTRHEGPPPRYEDIIKDNQTVPTESPPRDVEDSQPTPTPTDHVSDQVASVSSSIEFPLTHFYELEGRVHTEQWSIPYKRDESLAVCMVATIKMVREGERVPLIRRHSWSARMGEGSSLWSKAAVSYILPPHLLSIFCKEL